jgi:hypothetical protein
VLIRQKQYGEAEDILLDVIKRQRQTSLRDGENLDRLLSQYYLLECFQNQGKIADAVRTCDELTHSVTTVGDSGLDKTHPFMRKIRAKREELQAARSTPVVEDEGDVSERRM